jgi:hypothetical protein
MIYETALNTIMIAYFDIRVTSQPTANCSNGRTSLFVMFHHCPFETSDLRGVGVNWVFSFAGYDMWQILVTMVVSVDNHWDSGPCNILKCHLACFHGGHLCIDIRMSDCIFPQTTRDVTAAGRPAAVTSRVIESQRHLVVLGWHHLTLSLHNTYIHTSVITSTIVGFDPIFFGSKSGR